MEHGRTLLIVTVHGETWVRVVEGIRTEPDPRDVPWPYRMAPMHTARGRLGVAGMEAGAAVSVELAAAPSEEELEAAGWERVSPPARSGGASGGPGGTGGW